VAWEQLAEKLEHSHKGDFINLVGRLQTRSYEKDGRKNWITEVIAWNLGGGATEPNAHGVEVSDADIPF
jgi:single-stranded DNA-binding protein